MKTLEPSHKRLKIVIHKGMVFVQDLELLIKRMEISTKIRSDLVNFIENKNGFEEPARLIF